MEKDKTSSELIQMKPLRIEKIDDMKVSVKKWLI